MWPNFARCLANVDILNYICTNYEFVENIVNFAKLLDFGAVQKCAALVDLKKMLKNEYLLTKIGFDTAENEPSEVWS